MVWVLYHITYSKHLVLHRVLAYDNHMTLMPPLITGVGVAKARLFPMIAPA